MSHPASDREFLANPADCAAAFRRVTCGALNGDALVLEPSVVVETGGILSAIRPPSLIEPTEARFRPLGSIFFLYSVAECELAHVAGEVFWAKARPISQAPSVR
jgi:hypothetical protein